MIHLIYKTDNWYTHASRDLIAITDSLENILPLIKQQADKEGEALSDYDIYNIDHIKQTQNYIGEGEFVVETFEEDELNKLL